MADNHKKSDWLTYAPYGYTYDVAQDQRSAGGVHDHEIRYSENGGWQTRIAQSNGRHTAYGPIEAVDDATGQAFYDTALQNLLPWMKQ